MFKVYLLIFSIIISLGSCLKSFSSYNLSDEVDSIESVSEDDYDIVQVAHTLHKRSISQTVRIRMFQKNLKLLLEPTDGTLFNRNTPVYLARKNKAGRIQYTQYRHNMKFYKYQDIANSAALIVEKDYTGKHRMTGFIKNHFIRPLEKHEIFRKRKSTNTTEKMMLSDDEMFLDDHIIFKIKEPLKQYKKESMVLEEAKKHIYNQKLQDFTDERYDETATGITRIYPKILVTTDYENFKRHDQNLKKFIKYMIVFFNGVDLKFRLLDDPEVRLHVAGLIIPMEYGVSNFSENNVYKGGKLLSYQVVNDLANEYNAISPLTKDEYDFVVAITGYDMIEKIDDENSSDVEGIASTGGACHHRGAIVEDNTKFSGVKILVHELGHLFGAPHDGAESRIAWLPGAEACPFEDGYLMSYLTKDEKSERWSECSLQNMRMFFKSKRGRCLRLKPKSTTAYPKVIPGTIVSIQEQCSALEPGAVPCLTHKRNICHKLLCRSKNETSCFSYGGAIDGTRCGMGICLFGDCILPKVYGR